MNEELLSEIQKEREFQNNLALDKLADYIGRREHTEKELRQKLSQRFPKAAVQWAIHEALERDWLTDPVELSERVTASLHRKSKGYLYIVRYLHKKGLPRVAKDLDLELTKARKIAEEKLLKSSGFSYEEKQKLARWLSGRGFDDETIRTIIYEE